ncbi:jg15007 [Pararge aegeria aegeria]|uniref:Jg15007 protein n=1 Tax=Pararge aegeria aegeria TaxID=348720 RepID=A0A8S4QJH0_9NEOP|nr:jg15007 [Pararge aegeria aegeria]
MRRVNVGAPARVLRAARNAGKFTLGVLPERDQPYMWCRGRRSPPACRRAAANASPLSSHPDPRYSWTHLFHYTYAKFYKILNI